MADACRFKGLISSKIMAILFFGKTLIFLPKKLPSLGSNKFSAIYSRPSPIFRLTTITSRTPGFSAPYPITLTVPC